MSNNQKIIKLKSADSQYELYPCAVDEDQRSIPDNYVNKFQNSGTQIIKNSLQSNGGFVGNLTGNVTGNASTATLADKADKDSEGSKITDTYMKKASVGDGKLTLTFKYGTEDPQTTIFTANQSSNSSFTVEMPEVVESVQDVKVNETSVVENHIAKLKVIDNVESAEVDVPLSANQGRLLNERMDNIENIGRFLSLWNAETGKPETDPPTMPRLYNTGDYYRVNVVSSKNYQPEGSQYTGEASTTVCEDPELSVGDVFLYDGSVWILQKNKSLDKAVQDVRVDNVTIVNNGIANLTSEKLPNVPLEKVSEITADASEINILDGATITTTELNYLDGVTSNVQTQLGNKQDTLATQTAYSGKGTATKVPQITTNKLGQVTNISEVTIEQPTVNNPKITIKMNKSNKDSFTLNQSSDKTIDLGTVITSVDDKADKSSTVTNVSFDSNYLKQTIDGKSSNIVKFSTVATSGKYSDLSGTPATPGDYVKETNSSGNWTYRKWSSGVVEAWALYSVTTSSYSGSWAYVPPQDIPSGIFSSTPSVHPYASYGTAGQSVYMWISSNAYNGVPSSTSAGAFYIWKSGNWSGNVTFNLHLYCIGK